MKTFFALPLVTEKSLAQSHNKVYQFVVPRWVNKKQIASFIAGQYGVTVQSVKTAKIPAEKVTFRRQPGVRSGYKKAIIGLLAGQEIPDFNVPVSPASPASAPAASEGLRVDAPTESNITVRKRGEKKRGA